MELTLQKINDITQKVQRVLVSNFTGNKALMKPYRDRLNFSCPYCGDSIDGRKKRGNIYFKSLSFHCFNCSKHTNLVEFFKDHNQSIANTEELIFYLDYIRQNQITIPSKEYLQSEIFEYLRYYSIPLDEIKKKFNLSTPKENIRIEKYLKGRFLHHKLDYFMYDPIEEQLYIFNLTPDKQRALGWQIRNFKPGRTKYISYNIEKVNYLMYERKIEANDEDIIKMNTLSIYFNITTADFTRPVMIFEGPIDSMLCPNSIAISGVDKPVDMFDEISTVRYFFDNDFAGKKKMEYLLKKRKSVFMWNKIVRDYKVQEKVKDFNDLLRYCWHKKNDAIKNYDKYFTDNPLDLRQV